MSEYNEAPIVTAAGATLSQVTWALAVDGIIQEVASTNSDEVSPFPDAPIFSATLGAANTGRWSINCTGGQVIPGYLTDAKGNVTPAEGRVGAIQGLQPAYHGPVAPIAYNTPVLATESSGQSEENKE